MRLTMHESPTSCGHSGAEGRIGEWGVGFGVTRGLGFRV